MYRSAYFAQCRSITATNCQDGLPKRREIMPKRAGRVSWIDIHQCGRTNAEMTDATIDRRIEAQRFAVPMFASINNLEVINHD